MLVTLGCLTLTPMPPEEPAYYVFVNQHSWESKFTLIFLYVLSFKTAIQSLAPWPKISLSLLQSLGSEGPVMCGPAVFFGLSLGMLTWHLVTLFSRWPPPFSKPVPLLFLLPGMLCLWLWLFPLHSLNSSVNILQFKGCHPGSKWPMLLPPYWGNWFVPSGAQIKIHYCLTYCSCVHHWCPWSGPLHKVLKLRICTLPCQR